jgi:hypothetical protein
VGEDVDEELDCEGEGEDVLEHGEGGLGGVVALGT